jgi:hypothetical protein
MAFLFFLCVFKQFARLKEELKPLVLSKITVQFKCYLLFGSTKEIKKKTQHCGDDMWKRHVPVYCVNVESRVIRH